MKRGDFFRGMWLSPLALVRGPETLANSSSTFDAQGDDALADQLATTTDVFNVKSFDATGDGVTDDTAAIQAWLDAVLASNGVPGFLPAGDYLITSQLTVDITNRQSFKLVGSGAGQTTPGPGTRLLLGGDLASPSTPMLVIDGTVAPPSAWEARITIEDIAFIGNGNTGSGLHVTDINNRVAISRCVFSGFSSGTGIKLTNIIGIHLLGIHAESNDVGFDHNAGISHGEGSVVSCKFTGNTTDNVILGGGIPMVW